MPSLRSGTALAAVIVFVFWCCVLTIVVWKYLIFRNDVDLGIFTQVVASVGNGFSSTPEGGVNHLAVHWSPTIVLAWPFLRAFGPLGLEISQALLIGATLFPIWGLAKTRFSPPIALAVVAISALYPILCANAVADFHEMAFVPLLSAALVYAVDRRNWRLGYACALLLACTKEDQFVVLGFAGFVCALLARGDKELRRFGALLVVIAGAGATLYFGVVRNAIAPGVPYAAAHFFAWPQADLAAGAWPSLLAHRAVYALAILAPLAFLPLCSRYGLFLIPGFVEVFASHEPVTLAPGAHYSALLTGYALAAFVDGASVLQRFGKWLPLGALGSALALSLWFTIWNSPMEYWYYLYRGPNAHDALLQRTLDALPANADAGSEDEIFSHMGLDRNASIDMMGQQWFVYDRSHYSDRWHFVDEPRIRQFVGDRSYAVVSDKDGIVVLRRVRPVTLPPN